MTRKQKRLSWIGTIGLVLALAVGLVLYALSSKISFSLDPTELLAKEIKPGERIRLFGLVKEGSVKKGEGLNVNFELTDTLTSVPVAFNNILPDLFREGQGIITEGVLRSDGTFAADSVLAKHDENYMPKEVAESLKEKGLWQETKK
jgi:cytochrome c-type biogenesis protein CcmE